MRQLFCIIFRGSRLLLDMQPITNSCSIAWAVTEGIGTAAKAKHRLHCAILKLAQCRRRFTFLRYNALSNSPCFLWYGTRLLQPQTKVGFPKKIKRKTAYLLFCQHSALNARSLDLTNKKWYIHTNDIINSFAIGVKNFYGGVKNGHSYEADLTIR